ncbi:tRNA (guanosine(46)-N7)-methyltransferase TrmB [Pelagibius sp. Alg239-R121]|uniref:tRNA (guanosine(46)-N7)-methyltransferase TrmB n=1 Tax=Pelagibius sp. Alg239-R121 TaxID=2993448 RepID=UPI0024A6360A|nr:tRNA (guanosine(46)-N7)-methyltransferase TrmB [Pelagibius sp. Alg239-R121]
MSKSPDTAARHFYGRRHGRPLRAKLRNLVETLLPKVRIELTEGTVPDVDPRELFSGEATFAAAPNAEFWLEIGFGGGEHLAWQAEHHPEVGFIGAEYFFNGIASLLRHIDDRQLKNLRVYEGDVRDLLPKLPDASLTRVFILFPDPWPKSRHNKRRLVQDETLDELARVMADGAELRLGTDDPGYLNWMLEYLMRRDDFVWTARGPQDWRVRTEDWPQTRYERKAIEAGRKPAYLKFRRCRRSH